MSYTVIVGVLTASLGITADLAQTALDHSSPSYESHVYSQPNTLVRVEGRRRLNMLCMGYAAPTVILVNGGDSNIMVWRKVQARIAAFSRVCAYDKAGFGFSDAAPRLSSVGHDVDDLRRLLDSARIAKPVVLVGHSLGGEDAVLFAGRYPNDVGGMVLVDPAFAGQARVWSTGRSPAELEQNRQGDQMTLASIAKCVEQARIGALTRANDKLGCLDNDYPDDPVLQTTLDRQEMSVKNQRAQMSEMQASMSIAEQRPSEAHDPFESVDDRDAATAPTDFGDMPLIVLTRQTDEKCSPQPACLEGQARWKAAHDALARYSSAGRSIVVPGAGHVIQEEQPDSVVNAVRKIVDAVRQRR